MRHYPLAVWVILLAAAAAPAQRGTGEPFPKPPGPVQLPPPPSSVSPPPPLPSVAMPAPLQFNRMDTTMAVEENVKPFDPQRLELKYDKSNGWMLIVDGTVLKAFGGDETDAKAALHLVRDLGLNQHGTVGSPAVMEYWLHDGRAPHGATNGLQVYPLDTATLRVDQVQDHWCLRDAQRMLFDFGAAQADALHALGVIRKHGFTQVGALGQSGPVMLVFLGRGATLPIAAEPVAAPPLPHSPDGPVRTALYEQRVPPPVLQPVPVITGVTPVVGNPSPLVTTSATEANPIAHRLPVDWRQTKMEQDGPATWKLVSDTHELARFGSEREAQLALSALLYFRFTEREEVGSPKAHFTYYLTDGQLPRGAMIGLPCEFFQPDRLKVAEVAGRWTISTGERVLLSFDDKQDEARHVLDVIRQNKCDRLYHVGLGEGYGMTFLAKSR